MIALIGVLFFTPDALLFRLTDSEPLTVAFWRGLMAGAVLLTLSAFITPGGVRGVIGRLDGRSWQLAVIQGLNLILFCAALWYTSAANTLIIIASAPMIAALLSLVILREKVEGPTWIAMVAVGAGVVLVASAGVSAFGGLGETLALLNAVMIAAFFVVVRGAGEAGMIPAVGLGYLLGAIGIAPFAEFPELRQEQWMWLALSGLVMLPGALIGLTVGARYLPPPEISLLVLLEVILGPLLVWWLLGEDPGSPTLLGGAIIVLALFLHAWWRLRTMAPEEAT